MKTAQIFDDVGQQLQYDPTLNMACSSSYSMQSLPSSSGKEDSRSRLSIGDKSTVIDKEGLNNALFSSINNSDEYLCIVCGDGGAKMHYGVLACLGCKGFFRRALKKANEYECLRNNDCKIDKYERNSCRACRLQKCLDSGMDPFAVRPDRDFTGKQRFNFKLAAMITGKGAYGKRRSDEKPQNEGATPCNPVEITSSVLMTRTKIGFFKPLPKKGSCEFSSNEWIKRLRVEMRTMLMSLLNMEAQVTRGDTSRDASEIYPLGISTLKEIIDEPTKLTGRRTEMRYEPYRMARNEEFSAIVYRRLIAAIDWVNLLAEMMADGLSTEDKIILVKSAFGPLTLFKCSARTAAATKNDNVLCLCNFAYVPRDIAKAYSDTYHLDNGLVDRLLNQLVLPFRQIHLTDEEIVCLSAIIVLNPMAKDLSEDGTFKVNQLRNRVYDTLYGIVKELRGNYASAATIASPASQFGNLLLFLPIVTYCANMMSENLRFAQTFSSLGGIPLLTSLFGCFPVEPFLESEFSAATDLNPKPVNDGASMSLVFNESTLLEGNSNCPKPLSGVMESNFNPQIQSDKSAVHGKKRRLPLESIDESNVSDFWLLRAPCAYTLTEMFDDRTVQEEESTTKKEQPTQHFPAQQDIIDFSTNSQKPNNQFPAQTPISKSKSLHSSGIESADVGPLLFAIDNIYQQQQRYGSVPLVSSIPRRQPQSSNLPQMVVAPYSLSSSASCQWSATDGSSGIRMTSASNYWTISGGTVSGLLTEAVSSEHCKQPRQLIGRRQTLPHNMEFQVSAAAAARQCCATNNLPDGSNAVNDSVYHRTCFNNDRQLQYDTEEYVAQCCAAEGSILSLCHKSDVGRSAYSMEVQSSQQQKQWPTIETTVIDGNNILTELNGGAPKI